MTQSNSPALLPAPSHPHSVRLCRIMLANKLILEVCHDAVQNLAPERRLSALWRKEYVSPPCVLALQGRPRYGLLSILRADVRRPAVRAPQSSTVCVIPGRPAVSAAR